MVLSLLAVHGRAQLWIIYVVAFCYGIAFSILSRAGAGLRKDMLADDELGAANAALQTVGQGLRIVAPLAGAGLYVAVGGSAVAVPTRASLPLPSDAGRADAAFTASGTWSG